MPTAAKTNLFCCALHIIFPSTLELYEWKIMIQC